MRRTGVHLFLSRATSLVDPYYQEIAPARDLTEFVACTWIRVVRCTTRTFVDAILPDGCADIMVYDDHPPRVAGPDSMTRHTLLWDGLVIVGIRLKPGACRAVLGCPASEIVNGGALLSDIVQSADRLHRTLLASSDLQSRVTALEQWVRSVLATGYADQAHMTRDFRAITGFAPRAYFSALSPGWGAWLDSW